tara:strand:- start:5795 stop:7882 length:2088 start_codon:yes stop_codon:yes gene_type:complete
MQYPDALSLLLHRFVGGSETAAAPGDQYQDFWPLGKMLGGGDEALEWFMGYLENLSEDESALMFLVGGPGNGKSVIGNLLAQSGKYKPIQSEQTKPHHRKYFFELSDQRKLTILNDATMPADSGESKDEPILLLDFQSAVEKNECLVANVNRGVIYREINEPFDFQPSNWIAKWLQIRDSEVQETEEWSWIPEPSGNKPLQYATLTNKIDKHTFHLLAVHMDLNSLFEGAPSIKTKKKPIPHPAIEESHRIEFLKKRTPKFDETTPAGQLFDTFFSKFHKIYLDDQEQEMNAPLHDPFFANLQSLQSPLVQNGVLTILRSAEIVNASRMSYRNLWEVINRLILGDPSYFTDKSNPPHVWLADEQPPSGEISDTPHLHFRQMLRLANLRFHQGLFGDTAMTGAMSSLPLSFPAVRMTSAIDPTIDSLMGSIHDEHSQGWSSPVLNAFIGHAEGESILDSILENIEKDDPFFDAVTDFDKYLDAVFTFVLDSRNNALNSVDLTSSLSWYSQYLQRLYAVANGISAYRHEIDQWIKWWNISNTSSQVPDDFESYIRALILPVGDGGYITLPAFESRTEPITSSYLTRDQVGVRFARSEIEITATVNGDHLLVGIIARNNSLDTTIELDFPMMRELLAGTSEPNSNENFSGLTEMAGSTTPRLERIRASLLPRQGSADPDYQILSKSENYSIALAQKEN